MTRDQLLQQLCADLPSFRLKQAREAVFHPAWRGWHDASVFSPALREAFEREVPWMTLTEVIVLASKRGDTYKALLKTIDGERLETVLMRNARGHWSICVSSQVGCAMGCTFCATGRMGFTRNLTEDEIVDQYRFWVAYLQARPELEGRITNIVYMGMGEPLANYASVRTSIRQILEATEIGPTRIVVSTVGLVPMLQTLLTDPLWPPVRLAVSLHSADPATRQAIMPTSYPDFLDRLAEWANAYFEQFATRRRHVTFEYILLEGVNDDTHAADQLARFAHRVGRVRINLIPYNMTANEYRQSQTEAMQHFQERLEAKGVLVTRRRTMGEDIAAACGQLATETSTKSEN